MTASGPTETQRADVDRLIEELPTLAPAVMSEIAERMRGQSSAIDRYEGRIQAKARRVAAKSGARVWVEEQAEWAEHEAIERAEAMLLSNEAIYAYGAAVGQLVTVVGSLSRAAHPEEWDFVIDRFLPAMPTPLGWLSSSHDEPLVIEENQAKRLCVVAQEGDTAPGWASEYHALGALIDPADAIGPDKLNLEGLFEAQEVAVRLPDTLEGAATAMWIQERLAERGIPLLGIYPTLGDLLGEPDGRCPHCGWGQLVLSATGSASACPLCAWVFDAGLGMIDKPDRCEGSTPVVGALTAGMLADAATRAADRVCMVCGRAGPEVALHYAVGGAAAICDGCLRTGALHVTAGRSEGESWGPDAYGDADEDRAGHTCTFCGNSLGPDEGPLHVAAWAAMCEHCLDVGAISHALARLGT